MKTQVFFKATAVLMTALLICACEKGEKDDYKLGQDLSQMVTVIADIGKDAGTKITLGEDLGSTTEMLWSPEDSIALTDGQKLYVFTRSDDSDVPTERAEFTYNGKAGSLPAAGTERLKFIYPVSAPEQYSQQSGTIAVLSEYMQMEAVIPEGTVSLGGLLLTFSHKTSVIKLELENEAFINQEASVIFAFRDLADGKDKTIKTQNLKADANGVVTAYLVHPAASVDDIHIYVKTSSALYETTLSPKQIIPGKLYKVRKNDFVQSNIGLEGMLPEGDIFRSAVAQLILQNSSIVRIKFIAESEVDGTPIGDSDAVMVVNGDCLEIHTSASEFMFNENCHGMFRGFRALVDIDFNDCINTSNVTDMSQMFSGCESLISLDLSSFDTSKVTDMSYMFYRCGSLTTLDLSGFDTSNVTDMSYMFCRCESLTSLDMSNFDTSEVTGMRYLFSDCQSLISLNLSSFDTSNVTDMSHMFYKCYYLTSLDLTGFDFIEVKSYNSMFVYLGSGALYKPIGISVTQEGYEILKNKDTGIDPLHAVLCSINRSAGVLATGVLFNSFISYFLSDKSSLTRIKFIAESQMTGTPIWDSDATMVVNGDCLEIHTSAPEFVFDEDCSRMFGGFTAITEIDFNNCINTSNVTNMGALLSGCKSLKSLDLSDFDTSNVTNMYNMFSGCQSLTSLDLSGFDTSNVTNMSYMFSGCQSLTSLDLSSFDTSNVTDISSMFDGCQSLTSLDLSGFDTSNVTDISSMFDGCQSLTSLDLSSFDTSKVTGMRNLFFGCQSLTSVDLNSFNTSNVINMSGMFGTLRSLTSVDLSGFDTSKVTDMSALLSGCQSLTSVDLSGFDTSKVTDMSALLSGCKSLTSVDLSSFDTSNVTGMRDMFSGCQSLTSVDLSGFDTSKVTGMRNMFYGCQSLTSLDLSSFDTSKVTDMSWMFYGCRSLTSLDLSSFDTSKVTDMRDMFRGCQSLTSLDLSGFDTSKVTGMRNMFYGCQSLTSLDLSRFDTSKVINMSGMFYVCHSLTSLDLSRFDTSNVKNMSWMFNVCRSLTSLDLSSFDTSKVTDMSWMFSGCQLLASLDLTGFDFSEVKSYNEMFVYLGSDAPDKPINVSVTQEGYDILNAQSTGIDDSYARLVVVP